MTHCLYHNTPTFPRTQVTTEVTTEVTLMRQAMECMWGTEIAGLKFPFFLTGSGLNYRFFQTLFPQKFIEFYDDAVITAVTHLRGTLYGDHLEVDIRTLTLTFQLLCLRVYDNSHLPGRRACHS